MQLARWSSLTLTGVLLVLAGSLAHARSPAPQSRKLNAPLVAEGDVFTFEISPDGVHALYLADQELNDRRDLYAVRLDGSAPPVRLNPGWPSSTRDVAEFVLTPDGTRVVYRADQDAQDVFELFGAPVDGSSSAVRLHPPLVAAGDVGETFAIAPDGSRVVYLADAEVDEVLGLYSAAVDGGPAVKLSGSLALPSYFHPRITTDSSRVVFLTASGELHVVPLDGSAPPLKLNDPGTAASFFLDSLGVRAVFFNQVDDGIHSVPLDGSEPPVRLNLGNYVGSYRISADGARVVFGSVVDSVHEELFSAPIDGSAPQTSIGGPPVAGRVFAAFDISPDSSRVVFLTRDGSFHHQLLGTSIDGSTPPVDLAAGVPVGYSTFSISSVDQRVVFTSLGFSLYAVPSDGSSAPSLLTTLPLVGAVALFREDRRVAFASEGNLYEAPMDGSEEPRVVTPPMTTGGNLNSFLARGRVIVYRADQDTDTVFELYAYSLSPRRSEDQGPLRDLR